MNTPFNMNTSSMTSLRNSKVISSNNKFMGSTSNFFKNTGVKIKMPAPEESIQVPKIGQEGQATDRSKADDKGKKKAPPAGKAGGKDSALDGAINTNVFEGREVIEVDHGDLDISLDSEDEIEPMVPSGYQTKAMDDEDDETIIVVTPKKPKNDRFETKNRFPVEVNTPSELFQIDLKWKNKANPRVKHEEERRKAFNLKLLRKQH